MIKNLPCFVITMIGLLFYSFNYGFNYYRVYNGTSVGSQAPKGWKGERMNLHLHSVWINQRKSVLPIKASVVHGIHISRRRRRDVRAALDTPILRCP